MLLCATVAWLTSTEPRERSDGDSNESANVGRKQLIAMGRTAMNRLLRLSVACMMVGDIWVPNASAATAPRTVEYDLTIGYFLSDPDGMPVNVLGINGQLPSPTLSVTQGDTLVVNVRNQDPVHGHSLHWHGLSMRGSPEMDGVVGVTQCSLRPFQEMQYKFVVEDHPGTYWYHGHSGLNRVGARGIAGMLVVHAREGEEPHADLYREEASLFLQDWSHEPPHDHYLKSRGGLHPPTAQSANAHNVALYPWTSGLINGIGDEERKRYSIISLANEANGEAGIVRMRICNGGENFALRISIDCHHLLVIATDGTSTEPLLVDSVIVHLGERYDVIPIPTTGDEFTKAEGNYWVRASTLENDRGAQIPMNNEIRAVLRYARSPKTLPTTTASPPGVILNCFDVSVPSLSEGSTCLPITALVIHSTLRYKYNSLATSDPDETHEVAFEHSRGSKHYGHFTRVRSNVEDTDRSVPHRSGEYTQFVLPGRPLYDASAAAETADHDHTLHLDLHHGNNVQIVWNHRSRTAHPIHIHGYKFVVAATHEAPSRCSIVDCADERDWFRWPLDRSVISETIRAGKYIVKDTAVLPAGGYLVTRFVADNPGHWIAHCHTDFHLADGMAVILREGGPTPIGSMPPQFPSCSGAEYEVYDTGAISARQPACQCLNDPETVLHAAPESWWKCSTDSLCRHAPAMGLATDSFAAGTQVGGERVRGVPQGREWTKQIMTIVVSIFLVCAMSLVIKYVEPTTPTISIEREDGLLSNREQLRILVGLVLRYEWKRIMKFVMLAQVVGLATVGGLIYFDAGYDTSERSFRERIAFVFWQCAFWSVSTVYGSCVTYHLDDWIAIDGRMVWIESHIIAPRNRDQSLVAVGVGTYHLTRFAVSLLLASPWPFIFAFVTESFSQTSPTIWATLGCGGVLLLTQQAFDGMGCLLAEVAGPDSMFGAVCLATIVSQLLVISGGFYRTVPAFVSAVGPIRYSFAAISKMTFSASDSFWCTPDRAMAWRGYTFCSTELSGAIADLKLRGLDVVNSSDAPRVWPDILALVAIIAFFRFGIYLVACFNMRVRAKRDDETQRSKERRHSSTNVVPLRRASILLGSSLTLGTLQEVNDKINDESSKEDSNDENKMIKNSRRRRNSQDCFRNSLKRSGSLLSLGTLQEVDDKINDESSNEDSNDENKMIKNSRRRRNSQDCFRNSLTRSGSLLSLGTLQEVDDEINDESSKEDSNDENKMIKNSTRRRNSQDYFRNSLTRSGSLLSLGTLQEVDDKIQR